LAQLNNINGSRVQEKAANVHRMGRSHLQIFYEPFSCANSVTINKSCIVLQKNVAHNKFSSRRRIGAAINFDVKVMMFKEEVESCWLSQLIVNNHAHLLIASEERTHRHWLLVNMQATISSRLQQCFP
jgi:hypothetical protein